MSAYGEQMNRKTSFLFRKIGTWDLSHWKCAHVGDDLVISPKKSQAILGLSFFAFLGGCFIAAGLFTSTHAHPELGFYDRMAFILVGAGTALLGPILSYWGSGEWRLNSEATEFHYFFRRRNRPVILPWKDVERLKMLWHAWILRGRQSKIVIPINYLSPNHHHEVDGFLREKLSSDFDLTIKRNTGSTFQFMIAPFIGLMALMWGGMAVFSFYVNRRDLQAVIQPIVVVWLFGIWVLDLIGFFVAWMLILHKQANKDNPWRFRREHESPMIHEFEVAKN